MEKTAEIGAGADCLAGAENVSTPYVVFELPVSGKIASLSVGSVIEANRVVAPAVFTISPDGKVQRSFSGAAFRHRGRTLSVLFVPKPAERFVAVAADPAMMGGALSFVTGDPVTAAIPANLGQGEGVEYRKQYFRTYSYEGQVFARVYFSEAEPTGSQNPQSDLRN